MESVLVGAFGVNCLLLWENPSQTVIIDPGAEADTLRSALKKRGLAVSSYWLTHGHIDHISALSELLAEYPAPVFLHPEDAAWAFTSANRYPPYVRGPERPDLLLPVHHDQPLQAGGLSARVLHTPGHTPGSVCYFFEREGILVSGDTLFQGSVGRTDLPGGDWSTLAGSLAALLRLDDETAVLPGHGPDSTLGEERRRNPFLQDLPEGMP